MTKKRTYREPLDPAWAATLLSVPSGLSSAKTVAEVLDGLRVGFATAVTEARTVLAEHPFAEVIATEAARRAGRRGEATLAIGDDGQVYLEIAYKAQRTGSPRKDAEGSRQWSSDLPTIGELRDKAAGLGLDPEPYGRSKVKLQAAITAAEAPPKKKMMRTGVAVSPVTILSGVSPLEHTIATAGDVDITALTSK